MNFVNAHLGWILGIVIVAFGLVYGLGDVMRASWKRIWAISGVCFDESIRRRVAPIGGVELALPPRERVRRPPKLAQ